MIKFDKERQKESFIRNLKYLMYQKNYTIDSLAEKAHLSRSTIYYILAKKTTPTIKTIVNLSLALGVKVDSLIYYKWMYERI